VVYPLRRSLLCDTHILKEWPYRYTHIAAPLSHYTHTHTHTHTQMAVIRRLRSGTCLLRALHLVYRLRRHGALHGGLSHTHTHSLSRFLPPSVALTLCLSPPPPPSLCVCLSLSHTHTLSSLSTICAGRVLLHGALSL